MKRHRVRLVLVVLPLVPLLAPTGGRAQTPEHRLILSADDETLFTVEGLYPRNEKTCEARQPKPLRARYRGTIEILRGAGGRLRIITTLPFETYLFGLAEVPPSWPEAALRAQAIAARSYALDALRRRGARGSYDICATDACQVFRGAAVELGAFGERWVAAVRATRSQVLTYRTRVVQAFYFSTSDGRTRRSFPGGTPQPYYPSVRGEDGDAPLARWTARIPMRDLTVMLRRWGTWRGGTISSASLSGDSVRVSDGRASATLSRAEFRRALNNEAPCVGTNRYPTRGSADGRKMPQTVPSQTYTIARAPGAIVVRGRGWGHGVGMSQWGARSLAERGRSAPQILSHYYGPARVARVADPGRIRVLAADELRTIRVSADGPFSARTGTGSSLTGDRFEIRGGQSLQILRGRGPSLQPVLTIEPTVTRLDLRPGESASVPFTLSGSAKVAAEVLREGGVVARIAETSLETGARAVTIPLTDPTRAPLPPGNYDVVLVATDGIDRVRSRAVPLSIAALDPPPGRTTPSDREPRWPFLAFAAALLVSATALLLRRRALRRRNV